MSTEYHDIRIRESDPDHEHCIRYYYARIKVYKHSHSINLSHNPPHIRDDSRSWCWIQLKDDNKTLGKESDEFHSVGDAVDDAKVKLQP